MRVSTSEFYRLSTQDLVSKQSALSEQQLKISAGRNILKPSDDPIGSALLVDIQNSLDAIDQVTRNAGRAESRLGVTEEALASATSNLQRVRELTVQGANATQNNESRRSIAQEIRQRLQEMLSIANSSDANGEYIFAGNQTSTEPFRFDSSVRGGVAYDGDDGQRMIAIDPARQVAVNESGREIFMAISEGNAVFTTEREPTARLQPEPVAASTNSTTASVGEITVIPDEFGDFEASEPFELAFFDFGGSIGLRYAVTDSDGALVEALPIESTAGANSGSATVGVEGGSLPLGFRYTISFADNADGTFGYTITGVDDSGADFPTAPPAPVAGQVATGTYDPAGGDLEISINDGASQFDLIVSGLPDDTDSFVLTSGLPYAANEPVVTVPGLEFELVGTPSGGDTFSFSAITDLAADNVISSPIAVTDPELYGGERFSLQFSVEQVDDATSADPLVTVERSSFQIYNESGQPVVPTDLVVRDASGAVLFDAAADPASDNELDAGGNTLIFGAVNDRRVVFETDGNAFSADYPDIAPPLTVSFSGLEFTLSGDAADGQRFNLEPGNSGTGTILPGEITNPALYNPVNYAVRFNEPADSFDILVEDPAASPPWSVFASDVTYEPGEAGQVITEIPGIRFTISGDPAPGDTFNIEPAGRKSVFGIYEELIAALETPLTTPQSNAEFAEDIGRVLEELDQALISFTEARADVGGRLRVVETQVSLNADRELQYEGARSRIDDLDFAEAITQLQLQITAFQASQQSFIRIQNLSLFDIIG